jgi:hypothetical protein
MNSISGREIIDVLEKIGELDWYKYKSISEDEQLIYPPVIIWRFKKDTELDIFPELITKAVEGFQGKVNWLVEYNGKNWVLLPDLIKEMGQSGKFKVDSQITMAIAEDDPDYGVLANNDVPLLANHIYRKFKEAKYIDS